MGYGACLSIAKSSKKAQNNHGRNQEGGWQDGLPPPIFQDGGGGFTLENKCFLLEFSGKCELKHPFSSGLLQLVKRPKLVESPTDERTRSILKDLKKTVKLNQKILLLKLWKFLLL